jgi:DNA invertase Pin-like site-specific DNA recombinase
MGAALLIPKRRCAIYTRKSSEEGLDSDFSSLDAQRESAESFIASQRQEGWVALPARYDDGGFTGANTDRPALVQLMADIEAGRVDVVVVYKIDRLSRSLLDFVTLLQVFERHQVAFVSVTQQFNTATPMGRLILNILICFAQFERENIAERIRDKMSATRKKGKWVGGKPPLGYDVDYQAKRLVVNQAEATIIRWIFTRYTQVGSAGTVVEELNAKQMTTKTWRTNRGHIHTGNAFDRGNIYKILANPLYVGEVHYKGGVYKGEHEPIIERALWDQVRQMMAENSHARGNRERATVTGFLKAVTRCAHCGCAMGVSWTKKENATGVVYRYYRCASSAKHGAESCPVAAVPAGDLEAAVLAHLRQVFRSAPLIAATSAASQRLAKDAGFRLEHQGVLEAVRSLDDVWNELFPAEQARIAEMLISRVAIGLDHTELHLRIDGLSGLAAELQGKACITITPTGGEAVISLPIQARRRCGRLRLVVPAAQRPSDETPPEPDAIAVAVARAYRWQALLESGKVATVGALAKREGVDEAYVRRQLQLTLLAPPIIAQLLDGFEAMSVSRLTKQEVPALWEEQISAFGSIATHTPTSLDCCG